MKKITLKDIMYSMPVKITAYLFFIVSTCFAALCILGMFFIFEYNMNYQSKGKVKEDIFENWARFEGFRIAGDVYFNQNDIAIARSDYNNMDIKVYDEKGELRIANGTYEMGSYDLFYEFTYPLNEQGLVYSNYYSKAHNYYSEIYDSKEFYTVKIYLSFGDSIRDGTIFANIYTVTNILIDTAYEWRTKVYTYGIGACILSILLIIFLIQTAGRRRGSEEIVTGWLTKIPFDVFTGICFLSVIAFTTLFYNMSYKSYFVTTDLVVAMVYLFVSFMITFIYVMNLVVRIKKKGLWGNTLIFRTLKGLWRISKYIGKHAFRVLGNVPLIWKTVFIVLCLSIIELIAMGICYWDMDILFLLWAIGKCILVPVIFYIAIVLRKLQEGGKELAEGNFSYQVDTSKMVWEFREYGERLNSIGVGMNKAVEERMKSERMKTELITNVSHDIKTPLTSIINYSGLICKEETENEKVMEYAEVLFRQSERLKKLMEDLVEASKASSGNIEVTLVSCELGVILTQTVGEYEQRLNENQMELITNHPDHPIHIMADSRHLWRIFDNLLNNILKYGQSNTRVYINVEEQKNKVLISFKNISKYQLDITADELMERFVRGDKSRHTDGSGLGLSIARNLTELQHAEFELQIDGDLFKIVLIFESLD